MPVHAGVGEQGTLVAQALPLEGSKTVSRDPPTTKGQAWVCFDIGRSHGFAGGGLFYTANGPNSSSHDEVYKQNPVLEQAVGTRDEPTCRIFDCTQGTVGNEGPGGEATRLRQAKYGLNEAQNALGAIYDIRNQKTKVSST